MSKWILGLGGLSKEGKTENSGTQRSEARGESKKKGAIAYIVERKGWDSGAQRSETRVQVPPIAQSRKRASADTSALYKGCDRSDYFLETAGKSPSREGISDQIGLQPRIDTFSRSFRPFTCESFRLLWDTKSRIKEIVPSVTLLYTIYTLKS